MAAPPGTLPLQRYAFLKAIAHFEFAWMTCRFRECRKREKCAGGPRGTLRRLVTRGETVVPPCRAKAPQAWWDELRPHLEK